jgi:hypothetical protein
MTELEVEHGRRAAGFPAFRYPVRVPGDQPNATRSTVQAGQLSPTAAGISWSAPVSRLSAPAAPEESSTVRVGVTVEMFAGLDGAAGARSVAASGGVGR